MLMDNLNNWNTNNARLGIGIAICQLLKVKTMADMVLVSVNQWRTNHAKVACK